MANSRRPRPFQGLAYYPNYHEDDHNPRPTTWRKILADKDISWSSHLTQEIQRAIQHKISQPPQAYKPAIGDIIFFDGKNDGSIVIEWGNESRTGIPGTGRFTHVSIVVDVNADGTALIAEAGGAGVSYMRQATIRNMQTGNVFRPQSREFAYQYAKLALDATKFDVETHVNNLNAESPGDGDKFRNNLQNPGLYSWKKKKYKYVFSAPYSVKGMLASKASASANDTDPLITSARASALHNPGFRKDGSTKANTSFNPWCSRFAMMAIAGAYVEMHNPENKPLEDLFPNPGNKLIDDTFAKWIGKNNTGLRFISPKTLYEILLKAKDSTGENLFKKIGSWINIDNLDQHGNRVDNYHYNGGDASRGARPFSKNQFAVAYDNKIGIDPHVHEDGVTTIPTQQQDQSPKFKQLKTIAFETVTNLERTCDEINLQKILTQLSTAIQKATDYEDLLLTHVTQLPSSAVIL